MIGTVHIGEAFRMMRTETHRAFPKPIESRFLGEQGIGAMDPFAIFSGDGPQAHEEPVIADAVKGGVSPQSPGGEGSVAIRRRALSRGDRVLRRPPDKLTCPGNN